MATPVAVVVPVATAVAVAMTLDLLALVRATVIPGQAQALTPGLVRQARQTSDEHTLAPG